MSSGKTRVGRQRNLYMIKRFKFNAIVWLYPGISGWHFVTLPEEISEEIDFFFSMYKRGWGSLPVIVTLGKSEWKTSIFPDKKEASYILPLKAEIRKKEGIGEGDRINIFLRVSGVGDVGESNPR